MEENNPISKLYTCLKIVFSKIKLNIYKILNVHNTQIVNLKIHE